MFSCFLLLSTYPSIHYFVAHAGGQGPLPTRGKASSRRSLFSRVNGHSAAGGKPPSLRGVSRSDGGSKRAALLLPNRLSCGRVPIFPPSPMRRALHFLTKRKWRKRFASLRGLTAKSPTQRSPVKRGLRLWKQQPKQSPPFGQMPPTHQQTAALQLLEVSPIRQIVPLL